MFRVDEEGLVGLARGTYRLFILEKLRRTGFNAVGDENPVFDKDEANSADYVLGGTVRALQCLANKPGLNCRIAIEWQVLDVAHDRVVYKVVTRAVGIGLDREHVAAAGERLVLAALQSLIERPLFKRSLKGVDPSAEDDPSTPRSTFRACTPPDRQMPRDFEEAARATVLVRSAEIFGSAFFISPDGLLLTAAHVASAKKLYVKLRDGSQLTATVVRKSQARDVALLAVHADRPTEFPCLALNVDAKVPGTDLYALGAPASQDLAFSLTRGIVSGVRELHGVPLLQTDASMSPGNSGGPLLDTQARAAAVVSRKLAGEAVEGIGFGIPTEVALAALKLTPGSQSDPELLAPKGVPDQPGDSESRLMRDIDDPVPSLDPVGDRAREKTLEQQRREAKRDRLTPGYVYALRAGGVALSSVGALAAIITSQEVKPNAMTRSEYDSLRLKNDLSWALVGVGVTAFAVSYVLVPSMPSANKKSHREAHELALLLSPRALRLELGF